MTESKIYADDYSCTFKEPGEFLDFLRERKEHSQWLTAPSRSLQLQSIERDSAFGNLYMLLASGDPDHILSGVTNHYLSGNWEPIDGVSDCQQPRLANCLFLRRHRLNGLYLTGL